MDVSLDKNDSAPLYLQIKNGLKERIEAGALPPDTRLPPTRKMAAQLGVSRITVVNAYAELEAEGLIRSHVGRGTFVAGHVAAGPEEDAAGQKGWPWQTSLTYSPEVSANAMVRDMLRLAQQPGVISFAMGCPATDCLPVTDFRQAVNAVLRRDGAEALQYDVTEGYHPLRLSIAQYLLERGIHTRPENILITSGSQQSLALVAQVMISEGEYVITESPTYLGAIDVCEARGARIVGIPLDEAGMKVEMVENVILRYRPRLIYTMPTFHNPTGVSFTGERRSQLLTVAQRYGITIVEDAIYNELRYNGKEQPCLRAMDESVIYVGGFSKILLPGIRVGYLVASPGLYDRLVSAKQTADLHTSSLSQRALDRYLRDGRLRAHLKKVCRTYHERRAAMIDSLTRHLPDGVHWSNPDGGFYLWVTLPPNVSAFELYLEAIKYGVGFAIGSVFFPDRRGHNHLRLNFAVNPPPVIEEGIRRLGKALKESLARRGEKYTLTHREATPALV